MSLEAKIEKLTAAVESLTERLHSMEAMVAIPPSAPAEPSAPSRDDLEAAAKEGQAKSEPQVTHEQVQQLCLKIVREDRSKKPKLKEILGQYGASLVQDVPQEKLAELKAKLEAA